MTTTTTRTSARLRRGVGALLAVTAAGAVSALLPGAPAATAAPDPCAASEIARTVGAVATSTAGYLDAHPQTDAALTAAAQQQVGPQSLAALKTYFDANPQAAQDMQQLQAPLATLSTRCRLPVTLPQVLGLIQGVQGQGDPAPRSLPNSLPAAQYAGAPGAGGPAPSSAASAGARGAGPLPGPVTAATG